LHNPVTFRYHDAMRCVRCGSPIPARRLGNAERVGARADYCSPSCRNAAKQARHRERTPKSPQDRIHLRNLAAHGMIAAKLLRDPTLLEIARANIRRWTERNGATAGTENWRAMLERNDLAEVLYAMLRVDDEGMRARTSSPFAGVLDQFEVELLARAHRP